MKCIGPVFALLIGWTSLANAQNTLCDLDNPASISDRKLVPFPEAAYVCRLKESSQAGAPLRLCIEFGMGHIGETQIPTVIVSHKEGEVPAGIDTLVKHAVGTHVDHAKPRSRVFFDITAVFFSERADNCQYRGAINRLTGESSLHASCRRAGTNVDLPMICTLDSTPNF